MPWTAPPRAIQGCSLMPSGAVADGPLGVRAHVDLHRTSKIHPVLPAAGVQESALTARATGEGDLTTGRRVVRLPVSVRVLPLPRAIDDRIGRDIATDGTTVARALVVLHHVVEVDDVSGAVSACSSRSCTDGVQVHRVALCVPKGCLDARGQGALVWLPPVAVVEPGPGRRCRNSHIVCSCSAPGTSLVFLLFS